MLRIPVVLDAEYRGRAPGGEFTDRETGEVIQYTENLKFEIEQEGDDVETFTVRIQRLAEVSGFDPAKLSKGDRVTISCTAVVPTKRGENGYLKVEGAEMRTKPRASSSAAA